MASSVEHTGYHASCSRWELGAAYLRAMTSRLTEPTCAPTMTSALVGGYVLFSTLR